MTNKKQEIIRTATRLFSEKGYSSTSVDEIAKESGMAKASFYKLFPSKEDVLLESILLFKEDLERRIQSLQGLPYRTKKEKLIHHIRTYLESTFENKIHLLMFTLHDVVSAQKDKLIASGTNIDNTLNLWIKGSLLDIYGPEIDPFAWDIAFLMRGIAIEYMRCYWPDEKASVVPLAEYIGNIVELVVEGLLVSGADYRPFWTAPPGFVPANEPNPFKIGAQVVGAIRSMERAMELSERPREEKEEYAQVLQQLLKQFQEEASATGIMKAYVGYLEQAPELRTGCTSLRSLLHI